VDHHAAGPGHGETSTIGEAEGGHDVNSKAVGGTSTIGKRRGTTMPMAMPQARLLQKSLATPLPLSAPLAAALVAIDDSTNFLKASGLEDGIKVDIASRDLTADVVAETADSNTETNGGVDHTKGLIKKTDDSIQSGQVIIIEVTREVKDIDLETARKNEPTDADIPFVSSVSYGIPDSDADTIDIVNETITAIQQQHDPVQETKCKMVSYHIDDDSLSDYGPMTN